ncbi:MAG: AarF/ABC1/UbiB kinase family protein [Candidatus Pelagadaptatus aseana]
MNRFSKLGSLATRVAGSVLTNGAAQLIKGERPAVKDLLLTPRNIARIADQLASMRGAAMKVGQLMSMDAGDILPPALTEILARLRSEADSMPRAQLHQAMAQALGPDWRDRFAFFDDEPVAAASIGQVHEAITHDGDKLALKIQYPGVRESIDSDVDNVATLLSMTGLIPKGIDFAPLLDEAKRQLHAEADYLTEASMMQRYHQVVAGDERFSMPKGFAEFTSANLLAMGFMNSEPIELLYEADQQTRNDAAAALFELFFKETFEHGLVQTDPNFANYRYCPVTRKIVLLDFGATREYQKEFVDLYRELLSGVFHHQRDRVLSAALDIGLMSRELDDFYQNCIVDMCTEACEPVCYDGVYDFGRTDLMRRLHNKGMALSQDKAFWHVPKADSIFLHRKLGGVFLLASHLRAKINLRQIAEAYVYPN